MDERFEPSYETLLRATAPDPLFGTPLADLIGAGARRFIGAVFGLKLIRRDASFWFELGFASHEVEMVLQQLFLPTRLPAWPARGACLDLDRITTTVVAFRRLTSGIEMYIQDLEATLTEFGWRWNWDRLTAVEAGKGGSARMLERYILELLTEHLETYEITRADCRREVAPVMGSLFGERWSDTSASGILAQKLKDIHRARTRR